MHGVETADGDVHAIAGGLEGLADLGGEQMADDGRAELFRRIAAIDAGHRLDDDM